MVQPIPFFFLQSSRYWTRRWQDRAGWGGCQRKRSCPEALIWRRKTRRSVHVMAGARALTVSHKRLWKARKPEVASAKPSQPLKGRATVMWNGMEGERHVPPVLNLQHYRPERVFHSLKKKFLRVAFPLRVYFYLKKKKSNTFLEQLKIFIVFSAGAYLCKTWNDNSCNSNLLTAANTESVTALLQSVVSCELQRFSTKYY